MLLRSLADSPGAAGIIIKMVEGRKYDPKCELCEWLKDISGIKELNARTCVKGEADVR